MKKKTKPTRNEKRLAKKEAKAKKANPVKKPRAQRLPGMEDSGIAELENLAQDIADTIAEKKATMANEKNLNEQMVKAMKKHGKTTYYHAGIHIDVTSTEKAKVTITDDTDDTPADVGQAPAPNVGDVEVVHSEA